MSGEKVRRWPDGRPWHPPDGGDTLDTYEGWLARGFQVVKGAEVMMPRQCHGVRFGAVFGWHSVVPVRKPV